MFEFKLQLGCLIVVLYFTISYIKETMDKHVPCRATFDALLFASPWAIIMDGATAWTINHMDIVPGWVNLLLHCLFFVFMNVVIILTFVYMVDQTVGIKGKKMFRCIITPGIISIIGTLCFIGKLHYIEGETTNYSMGISVVISYASLVIHFLMILFLIILKRRTIQKRMFLGIVTFIGIAFAVLIAQVLYPEILLSSLMPMMAVIGIYVNFENPSFRRIEKYNAEMVMGFATLVENRDNSTGGHIKRTKGYVEIILNELRKQHKYPTILTRDYIENVINAAPMHDIGKIATPDHILTKPGKLTDEEYEIMKQHAATGGDIIKETFASLEEPEYQKIAYEMARFHHEKWNGKGYPDGLRGEEIPLHARIMAVADVFDAVSAKRCYRDAMPIDKCFEIIEKGAGTDFDPELAAIFLNAKEEVLRYYECDNKEEWDPEED